MYYYYYYYDIEKYFDFLLRDLYIYLDGMLDIDSPASGTVVDQGLAHLQESVISNAQTQKLSSPMQSPVAVCLYVPSSIIQRRPLMDEIEMIQAKRDDHQQPTRIALHISVLRSLLRICSTP